MPEDFPPNEKSGKWSEAVNGDHEEVSSGKTAWTLNEIETACQAFSPFNPKSGILPLRYIEDLYLDVYGSLRFAP